MTEIQNEIIEEFELFDDWEDKYAYLIDLGKKLPELTEDFRTDERRIKGCLSNVWLDATFEAGKVMYQADSDKQAQIARGMISLLLRVLSGCTPQQIIEAELYFFDKIGLGAQLTMKRANGLASMIQQMRNHAIAFAQ
ncbi:MAG: SufE family protein [Bacteroidetes bacterium]|nr:MAG: SufE family protein [Bacteroidota bacterium]